MIEKITNAITDLFFRVLFFVLDGSLQIVKIIESFFDIFAGTTKVTYQGTPKFLIDIFFSNNAVTKAFWAMTLIALVLAFMFCIYNVVRKVTDVTGSAKHTIGQIMSNFFRCILTLLLLNAILIAGINISNVLLDRINYVMLNAGNLGGDDGEREFTESEYGTMARVLATIGNYSVNPSYDDRRNINSCFNAIRGDLYSLQVSGVFDYVYEQDCWQQSLAQLASSADLTRDLPLDQYNENVANAFIKVVDQLQNNPHFVPVESVVTATATSPAGIKTDVLFFLIASMKAANNSQYNTGNIFDSLRQGYISGEKDYTDTAQVRKDFDISKMDYIMALFLCWGYTLIMAMCILTLIVRLFNLLLLYISAPLFVSSMPLDEGAKFQSWTQAFIIQMFAGFGMVTAMRVYLIMVPVIMNSDLVFFPGGGLWNSTINVLARALLIAGGGWAVYKSSDIISSILSGNPGEVLGHQESMSYHRIKQHRDEKNQEAKQARKEKQQEKRQAAKERAARLEQKAKSKFQGMRQAARERNARIDGKNKDNNEMRKETQNGNNNGSKEMRQGAQNGNNKDNTGLSRFRVIALPQESQNGHNKESGATGGQDERNHGPRDNMGSGATGGQDERNHGPRNNMRSGATGGQDGATPPPPPPPFPPPPPPPLPSITERNNGPKGNE